MTNPNQNPNLVTSCPLAHDTDGNPVALPEGAVAWRVRRHTGGRPRIQLGVDKQPMQFPLSYTLADLEDILPPGTYRLDLVDATGEPLGLTVPIAIGQPRNADGSEESESDAEAQPVAVPAILPSNGSDTRFVLEANVRSTQMAFQHNQKTLELGLRMAETLRDGVHVLADAQADWIKTLASSRGFFRNAPPLALPPPHEPSKVAADDEDDDDDDEDDAVEPGQGEDWVDKLGPLVAIVAQQVVSTLAARFNKPSGEPKSGARFELGDLFNWKRAHDRATASQAEAPVWSPSANPAAMLSALPPALLQKVLQAQGMLTPDEQQRAMQLIRLIAPTDLPGLAGELESMSAEQIADFLRAKIATPAA